jgi:hypothetical protein
MAWCALSSRVVLLPLSPAATAAEPHSLLLRLLLSIAASLHGLLRGDRSSHRRQGAVPHDAALRPGHAAPRGRHIRGARLRRRQRPAAQGVLGL